MYRTNPDELQNEKCLSCRFCVWSYDRKDYVCDIKGCFENCCFIEYKGEYVNSKWI